MKKASRLLVFITIAVALLMSACAPTSQQGAMKAANVLLVTQQSIVSVASAANNLCVAGVLTQPQCDEVKEAYEKAKVSYNLVETSLATALENDSEDSWDKYQVFHKNFMVIYTDLLAVAASYGVTQ